MIENLTGIIIGITVYAGIYFFIFDDNLDPLIQKRLEKIKDRLYEQDGSEVDDIFNSLEEREKLKKSNVLDLLREQSDYKLQVLENILNKLTITNKIKGLMKIADVKMPIDVFFMIIGALILPFVMLAILKGNPAILGAGFVFSFIPFLFLKMKYQKRLDLFGKQFPDSLSIIANSLRAGHSLLASFQMVATESPYPMNKLFKSVSDEISLGREIRDALEDMNVSLPGSTDLKFFITAVLIQKEIGGNLAEILDTLNTTIRERHKLLGLIKTQTAQAQMSGLVLGGAPFAITGLVSVINPQYMQPLFNTSMGQMALFAAFMMTFTGYVIIQKITKIRV